MQFTSFIALIACFAAGASIPLVTLGAEQEASETTMAELQDVHTSSREFAHRPDLTAQEAQDLRDQLWALTSQGTAFDCTDTTESAACVDVVKLGQAQ